MYPHARFVDAPRGRASQMNAGAAVATGKWLLFLHADTRLAQDWESVIERANRATGVVGGSFRFALDSGDWRARLIEFGVRLRVALFGLPYGDQALFARRDVFDAMGGYRDLPLMEDVDLVQRLKRRGRLLHANVPARTSPRRWERDGWVRRSARNVWLILRYFAGASPATLAREYLGRHDVAVAMMARAPGAPGKSRLATGLSAAEHAQLRTALFADTLDVVRDVPNVDHLVVCEPPEACDDVRALVGTGIDVIAQRDGDLGKRMHGGIDDLFRRGAAGVVLVGSDLPDLPRAVLVDAIDLLRRPGERVVLGPASDGGYYLIGVKASHPGLFSGIAWGTRAVLGDTVARAQWLGLEVAFLREWSDVDDEAGLRRLASDRSSGAPRTRAWMASRRNVWVRRETA